MKKRIKVLAVRKTEGKLLLETEQVHDAGNLAAKGQMLVDSDQFSFIYILDNGEDFLYIDLSSDIWPHLKEAKNEELPVYAKVGEKEILLTQFHEELEFLLENIKGNANYGEEMEKMVESVFY